MSKQQIGVVGMAVMGKNLALNIESRGYSVALFNRTGAKTTAVVEEHPDKTTSDSSDGQSRTGNRCNNPRVASSP